MVDRENALTLPGEGKTLGVLLCALTPRYAGRSFLFRMTRGIDFEGAQPDCGVKQSEAEVIMACRPSRARIGFLTFPGLTTGAQ